MAKLLIIDDTENNRILLSRRLKPRGHEILLAEDAEKGLVIAKEQMPQLVLMDIGLPGMDGYEVVARLRAAPATRSALIVALTGYGRPEDRLKSRNAGFDAHLVKPVDPDALLSLLGGRLSE